MEKFKAKAIHSVYTDKPFDIDNIVSRMTKSQWTYDNCLFWAQQLNDKGIRVVNILNFYEEVLNRFDAFDKEMDEFYAKTKEN